jgi:hypothetical protein
MDSIQPIASLERKEDRVMGDGKKKVKAREFVEDLRKGMDDDALMTKHDLTRDQFHKVLEMAVDSGLLKTEELYARLSHSRTAVTRAFIEMQDAVKELSTITAVIDKETL